MKQKRSRQSFTVLSMLVEVYTVDGEFLFRLFANELFWALISWVSRILTWYLPTWHYRQCKCLYFQDAEILRYFDLQGSRRIGFTALNSSDHSAEKANCELHQPWNVALDDYVLASV